MTSKPFLPFEPIAKASEYRAILGRALHEHSHLTTRQENDPSDDIGELFTDNKQIRTLQKADWQILFGRRGTGKTTLLNKLADVIDNGREDYATLTLSLHKCVIDLPHDTPDRIKGLVQFEKFIMEIGYLLYRIYLHRTASKNKNRRITILLNRIRTEYRLIESSILNIATFAHRGTVFGAITDKTASVGKIKEWKTTLGIGSKLDLSFLKGAEQFSNYAEASIKKNLSVIKEEKYQETAFIDFSSLKRDFVDLLDALHIKTLFILLDEWSALDRRLLPLCQVHFAEYLKRAFFGTSRICLKISAIEHESKFEDFFEGSRIGLEVGADIFAQVNLDQIYNNRVINLREFFEELIYRRLRHCDSRIKLFVGRENPDRPIDGFLELMFDDKSGFDELINASGGIPRDFINRFDAVAAAYDHSVEKRWKEHRIREVIMRHSIGRVADHVKKEAYLSCIFDKIGKVVRENNSILFLIPKLTDKRLTSAVESLFASRLIHRLDLVDVPERIRSKYDCYFIDYGIFWDLTREKQKQTAALRIDGSGWPSMLSNSNSELERFAVDISKCQIEND